MSRRALFKTRDVTRASEAVVNAGLKVARVEIDPSGKIVVVCGERDQEAGKEQTMNDPFEWYVTQDEEAWRLAVGAETREAAIEFGRNEYGCESFMICEARKGHFRVGMDATDLEEWVLNNCEDQLGEDQDGILLWPKELYDFRRPFDAKGQPIDAAEIERRKQVNARRNLISADLRAMQEATVYAWAAKHGIEIDRPWMFAETRSEERMPVIEGAEQFGTPS